MKRVLIGALIFVAYLACVIAGGFALHLPSGRFTLFCIVLGLLGAATTAFATWYLFRLSGESPQAGGSDSMNLDALLRDADYKLRTSRLRIKSIAEAQIIYVVGEDNSAKTQTVLQSGLDVELLAGNLFRDGAVAPTQLANIWLAGSSVIVEAGGSLLQQPDVWKRLIRATQPGSLSALFRKADSLPPRAVLVCVSADRVPGPSEAGYDANQIRSSAHTLNERIRQLSQMLGISVPVYILFTKLDTLAHFADYVGGLSPDEVKAPLGSLVPLVEAGSGLYSEQASSLISNRLDGLIYALSEFRIEVLSRGGELKTLASAYEFPRDLQKRRDTIVDYVVEVSRPSQLGINPFLRGFFFTGMRAVVVENLPAPPAQQPANIPVNAAATFMFSLGGAQVKLQQQQPAHTSSRKIPQWAFLPNLFSQLLLTDKSALEASRTSISTKVIKRALVAFACSCLFIYFVLLTISFLNNRDLTQQVAAAAAAPVYPPAPAQFASAHDLQVLKQLGALLLTLDLYRKGRPPLMDRWGLYSGDALYPIACNSYSIKFRTLLLGPTQSNILHRLRSLPSSPPAGDDYTATYRPLKAYLMSTSNPEKSAADPGFLAPELTTAWAGLAPVTSDLAGLAQTQFQTYATILMEPESCLASTGGRPDTASVALARRYLNGFEGFEHIYQNMTANAAKAAPSIRFSDSNYIVDSYTVLGAFTRAGFAFMQDAFRHPDSYFSGEEWVLGPMSSPVPNRAALVPLLQKQYTADYIKAWREFLKAAQFVRFRDWKDAATKLSFLGSNSSAMMQFFSLVSDNTSVAPEIAAAFQAPQSVTPPSAPDNRLAAPPAQPYGPYLQGLRSLQQAIDAFNLNPLNANDPAAVTPIIQAAGEAKGKVGDIGSSPAFKHDPDGNVDGLSSNLLTAPIQSVEDLAKSAPSAGANMAAKAFCEQVKPVLDKFPFTPQSSVDATPEEVAQIFSPGQGELAQFYSKVSHLVISQGDQYRPNSATAIPINPSFLRFITAAEKVSSALFLRGVNQATLDFTLSEAAKVATGPDMVLNIDGQAVGPGQTAQIHWVSQPSSRITLSTPENVPLGTGPWAIFHFAFASKSRPPDLDVPLQAGGQTYRTVHFNVDGPGAPLLNRAFMKELQCVTTVTKP